MRQLFSSLLLVLACSDRAERPRGIVDSLPADSVTDSFSVAVQPDSTVVLHAFRSAAPPARSDTTRWTDTSRRGDTVFYSKGRAITSVRVLTDSTWFQLYGIPFGPYNLFSLGQGNAQSFTLTKDGANPKTILAQIATARAKKVKWITALTGGAHTRFKRQQPWKTPAGKDTTVYAFDLKMWRDTMALYNTPAIKTAVALAVQDGTILGNEVMDEPHNTDLGFGHTENAWGPSGWITKPQVDSMCATVKSIFPTLPAGPTHNHAVFFPEKSYGVCDFIIDQYTWVQGDIRAWRDAALSFASKGKHALILSLNIYAGGEQKWPKDPWVCPVPPQTFGSLPTTDPHYRKNGGATGGKGPFAPTCKMTPAQIKDWGTTLGQAGCGLLMWRFESSMMARSDYQQSFRDLATALSLQPKKPCRRS
jgi:hypothetical protein